METIPANPFKGLRPYKQEDQDKLFGRDRDLILMKDRVFSARTTLLFAGSGVGKTSFLNAKVIPELKEQYYVIWHNRWTGTDEQEDAYSEFDDESMRFWPPRALLYDLVRKIGLRRDQEEPEEIFRSKPDQSGTSEDELSLEVHKTIAQNLHPSSGQPGRQLSQVLAGFKKTLCDTAGDRGNASSEKPNKDRCILILDQFEEVFQYHAYEDYFDDFVKDICEIINNEDYQVRVVFSMREEFLGELSIFDNRISDIFNNYYRLKYPDKDEAKAIITLTSELQGITPDQDRVALLVEDLSKIERGGGSFAGRPTEPAAVKTNIIKRNFVAPPYLQIACERLWNEKYAQPLPDNGASIPAFLINYKAGDSSSTTEPGGDAQRVLREFCTERLSAPYLSGREQGLAAHAFDYLVTKQGAKMAYELVSLAGHMDEKVSPLKKTLERLSLPDARILRESRGPDRSYWFELYHDMYAPIVDNWKREYRKIKKFRDLKLFAGAGVAVFGMMFFVLALLYSVPHWLIEPRHYQGTLVEFKNKVDGSNLEKVPGYWDAISAFYRLRATTGYSDVAGSLWADVLTRRAQWYASEGNRDNALLSLLKAAALEGDAETAQGRLRDAELLLDGEYPSLVTTYGTNSTSVDLSSDGKFVLTLNRDGQVKLWLADSGEPLFSLCDDCVQAFFSVDGKFVLTSRIPDSSDAGERRPDARSKTPAQSNLAAGPLAGLSRFKPANEIEVKLWDRKTGQLLEKPLVLKQKGKSGQEFRIDAALATGVLRDDVTPAAFRIRSVARVDSTYLIAEINGRRAYVWSAEEGNLLWTSEAVRGGVRYRLQPGWQTPFHHGQGFRAVEGLREGNSTGAAHRYHGTPIFQS